MELYLTYHKVLDKLEEFQQNYCCLNSFGYGNLVDFGKNVSGQTVTYPYLFVVPLSVSYDQNTTTYQLSAIFADRLNESLDNEKDAVSDMSLAARQLLSEIWRGNLQDYFDAPLPVNGQPFMERFNDYVAGIAIDLNLTVMEDINACPQWVITPFPSASPTATPTVTPTPSVTPGFTPGPTPSVTQTATPSATPIVPVNPSTLGALWWVDYHLTSNLILSGNNVLAAKDLISNNYIFSAYTFDFKPQYESTGYLSLSGCVTNGNNRGLSNALGLYGSITEYTQFWNSRRNAGPTGYISESDNRMNYLDEQQGYRWFSVDNNASPATDIRTYTFYATGESVSPEPSWSSDTNFHFGATRVYQNGADVTTELWIDGSIVASTTNLNRSPRTSTNPIFNLIGNNALTWDSMEQFFFDRKLTNSEMASAFAYLNQKYPNQ